ncbi:DUF6541 family protein [Dermabacteraceae bacterium P13136]
MISLGILSVPATVLALFTLAFAAPYPLLRRLGLSPLLALAAAPAAAYAIAGAAAIASSYLGIFYGPGSYFALLALCTGIAFALPRSLRPPLSLSLGMGRYGALLVAGASLCALAPIWLAFPGLSTVLQRWDMLFHLNTVHAILQGGDASSLHLAALARSSRAPGFYPGGFHALATALPLAPASLLTNLAALILNFFPWVFGTAALARALWPRVPAAASICAAAAALLPAAPLHLWLFVAPLANSAGYAALPGVLAVAVCAWRDLVSGSTQTRQALFGRALLLSALACGLAIAHPSALLALCLCLSFGGAGYLYAQGRLRSRYGVLALLAFLPVLALALSPLGSSVSGFSSSVTVPLWQGVGELLTGLTSVWPMPFGVALFVVSLPALLNRTDKHPSRYALLFCLLAWGALYLDASLGGPFHLSGLWYSDQNRMAPLVGLVCVLLLPSALPYWRAHSRARLAVLVALGATLLLSLPTRYANTAVNLEPDRPDRPRFLTSDEYRLFAAHAEKLRGGGKVLASPLSGASHLEALHGVPVYFPSAGLHPTEVDKQVMAAAASAGHDRQACALLKRAGIGYLYEERRDYHQGPYFSVFWDLPNDLGPTLFSTDHSRMIKLECRAN